MDTIGRAAEDIQYVEGVVRWRKVVQMRPDAQTAKKTSKIFNLL